MTSTLPATAFNVFRWSALGVGVVYGIVHRNTLARRAEHKRKEEDYAFKESLINEARAEYLKRKNPSTEPTEVNWNDPKSIEEAVQRFAEQK